MSNPASVSISLRLSSVRAQQSELHNRRTRLSEWNGRSLIFLKTDFSQALHRFGRVCTDLRNQLGQLDENIAAGLDRSKGLEKSRYKEALDAAKGRMVKVVQQQAIAWEEMQNRIREKKIAQTEELVRIMEIKHAEHMELIAKQQRLENVLKQKQAEVFRQLEVERRDKTLQQIEIKKAQQIANLLHKQELDNSVQSDLFLARKEAALHNGANTTLLRENAGLKASDLYAPESVYKFALHEQANTQMDTPSVNLKNEFMQSSDQIGNEKDLFKDHFGYRGLSHFREGNQDAEKFPISKEILIDQAKSPLGKAVHSTPFVLEELENAMHAKPKQPTFCSADDLISKSDSHLKIEAFESSFYTKSDSPLKSNVLPAAPIRTLNPNIATMLSDQSPKQIQTLQANAQNQLSSNQSIFSNPWLLSPNEFHNRPALNSNLSKAEQLALVDQSAVEITQNSGISLLTSNLPDIGKKADISAPTTNSISAARSNFLTGKKSAALRNDSDDEIDFILTSNKIPSISLHKQDESDEFD